MFPVVPRRSLPVFELTPRHRVLHRHGAMAQQLRPAQQLKRQGPVIVADGADGGAVGEGLGTITD